MNFKSSKGGRRPPFRRRAFRPGNAPILRTALLACALLASGCPGDSRGQRDPADASGGSRQAPGRLRIGIEAAPSSLDPRFATDADSSRIAGLVHCALVRPDGAGGWAPQLANSWRADGDRAWVFDLREDATFHDGRPVTAGDVVATWRAVLDPSTASPKRAALESVASVEAEGSRRVRVTLRRNDAAFFEGATLAVLPSAIASSPRDSSGALPGCGAYRIASAGSGSVLLEAALRPGAAAPSIAALEFRVVPDTVMRTLQLSAGELDLVQNALEPDAVARLAARAPGLRVTVSPYDAYQYIGINHRHPALASVLVRRAIAHAIDREGIVRNLLRGQAEVATGLLPPHHDAYAGSVRRLAYDPAAARRLLDRAGYRDPDGDGPLPRLKLRWSTSTVELRRRIAEAIAANLADVGIAVSIESWEWGTFFADIGRGNYDLYSLAWIGIRDPDLMRTVFHSAMTPPTGNNRGFFSNARIDRLAERGREETDPARRRAIYARLQRAAARQLPYIPLWWPRNVVVASTRLEGFEPSPDGDLRGLLRASLREEAR